MQVFKHLFLSCPDFQRKVCKIIIFKAEEKMVTCQM